MKGRWIAALFWGLLSGLLALAIVEGLSFLGEDGKLASVADGLDQGGRGCRLDAGSSAPYPESGAVELSAPEASSRATESSFASSSAPKGAGSVSFTNEDSMPVSATLVDEDGKPAAKAFLRSGGAATLPMPAGAYDVMVESGQDWTGQGFGACAKRLKAKGIAVVDPGLSSHVVLYGDLAFVLANRMDPQVGKRLLEDEVRRRQQRGQGKEPAERASRPEREERP